VCVCGIVAERTVSQKMPPITIIPTLSPALSEKFLNVLRGEKDFRVLEIHSFSQIQDTLFRQKVDIVIVEVRGLQDLPGIKKLIQKKKDLKVVLIGDVNKDIVLEYMKAGAKGCLNNNIPPDLLKKAIRVINKGEVWFDQKITSVVFEEFARLVLERSGQPEIMKSLSKREKEVLHLITRGHKNKDIAQALYISEKTVKTHIHHVFEKLGVKDRLNATLLVTK